MRRIGNLVHKIDRTFAGPHTWRVQKKITYPPRLHTGPRQIIGLRLPLDIANEVKADAAERNVSLKDIFRAMWLLYKKTMIFSSSPAFTGPRQMIGFSLPRDLAAEIKEEAARRKVTVTRIFIELWPLFKKSKRGA